MAMAGGFTFAAVLLGLLGRSSAGLATCGFSSIVEAMTTDPENVVAQVKGCRRLASCVKTNSKTSQDAAVAAGALEASIAAMRRFPDHKELQSECIEATARPILFNRPNGLRAGRLGGLNLTLAAYRKWIDDPAVTRHGGDIGCFLDFVNENRMILRELGGVYLLIQNIKNNFHGQYSEWDYVSVKNSLFGLSSGCWLNGDRCFENGFVQLSLHLMREHTSEDKIAEESLQAIRAMLAESHKYRQEFADYGLGTTLVKVLKENPNDRGALSVACATIRLWVGPTRGGGPTRQVTTQPFDGKIQARATREGLLDQLLATTMSGAARHHKDHSAFNFDIDEAYNVDADCLDALFSMGYQNKTNSQTMLRAGIRDFLLAKIKGHKGGHTKRSACRLLHSLTQNVEDARVLEQAKGALSNCKF